MTTRSLKTLAIALGCAAVLGGESTSAQSANNHTSEYSARPLPALPRTNAGAKSGRLFVIQSPAGPREPTVPTADAKARIVRQSAAPKQIFTQPQTPPTQTVDQPPQPREIAASALALPFETVAELTSDEAVDQTGENVAEMTGEEISEIINVEYHVAFQKLPQIDDQQLDLDVAPEPETDEDSAEFESDEAESDREPEDPSGAAEELDFEGEESADEADELAFEDEESDDEDDVRPKPRQFGMWPKKSMQEVRVDVREVSGDVPPDESGVLNASSRRDYRGEGNTEKVFAWAAPNIRYQPLYFEDVALERYGQTKGLVKQPVVSAYKFLRDGALLPFNASVDCPKSCDGPLGYCRPGSPAGDCGCSSCRR